MRNRRILILFVLFITMHFGSKAQVIEISAQDQALNEVVYALIDKYNLQVSFNDRQLSREKVSIHSIFESPEAAFRALLADTELELQIQNKIYIIVKKAIQRFFLKGFVYDKFSKEALPFAHVVIEGNGIITDSEGKFQLENESPDFDLIVSYLGYYIKDTTVREGIFHCPLTPSVHGLGEITVLGEKVERAMESGEIPGQTRLNPKVARKIAGNGDDAVFNFLRLQPGILAAGEQAADLIIWGSYEGHSKVIFDGFTIYGLKNFNDNLSAVNPFMTKDMLVLKGGYPVEYGGRVGGVVDITGNTGNRELPSINLNINNMTINGMASVPLSDKSVLAVAFRRTYYNLYDPENLTLSNRILNSVSDFSIIPDYTFSDFNVKYSGSGEKGASYFLSYYQGADHFSYNLDIERQRTSVTKTVKESNKQRGGSAYWNKNLGKRLRTDITLSYSYLLNNEEEESLRTFRTTGGLSSQSDLWIIDNTVTEMGLQNKYYMTLGKNNKHQLSGGLAYNQNSILLLKEENNINQLNSLNEAGRLESFFSDRFEFGRILTLNSGLRVDFPVKIGRAYIQPRFSLTVDPSRHFKAYLAWGKYMQYISKTSILDDYGNYNYFWAISDGDELPVLNAYHYVGGASLKSDHLSFGAEAFYKTTSGLTRYVNLRRENIIEIYEGDSYAYGTDLLLKGWYRKHEAWIAYSWSHTLEYFPYFRENDYRYAPHDQRHELKGSVLLNFNPFYFSMNYVYGSGFILRSSLNSTALPERYPYSRLDGALIYNLSISNYTFEIGISVLNILNTENIKYANFIKVPTDQQDLVSVHAEAVPFTPAIYLNLNF